MDYTAAKFQVNSKDMYYFGDWQSRGEYDPAGPTYVFNDDSGAATAMCFALYHFTGDTRYLEPALRGAKYFQRLASGETGLLGGVRHRGWRGSSADVGWGPYCVETGWSCAPLGLGLIMCLSDLNPAPARPGGSAKIAALSNRLDAEFEQVRHLLSLSPPAKVTGLRATPTRGNYVELLWDKPADGHAARYKVYRSGAPRVERAEQALAAATREENCLLPDLEPDQEYYFQVIAESAQGQTSAPSSTLRVRTGPVSLARGKPYTKSSQPTSYPDTGDRESTDGVYAGPYRDGRSYGCRLSRVGSAIDLDIVADLGAIRQIGRASHQACGAPGYRPDRLDLHTSTDGKTWTRRGSTVVHRSGLLVVDFTPAPTRYVKFRLHKQRRGATDDWLFVGELEVF